MYEIIEEKSTFDMLRSPDFALNIISTHLLFASASIYFQNISEK